EEGASSAGSSGRRWIIDPIDGTRDFIRGNAAWAVMLALEAEGEVVAGAVHFPAARETFHAARGMGAWCDGSRIRVSQIDCASQAVLAINGLNSIGRYPFAPRLLEWMQPFWAVRSMGGCLDAMMLARGQADLWLNPPAAPGTSPRSRSSPKRPARAFSTSPAGPPSTAATACCA